MFWNKRSDKLRDELISVLKMEVEVLRKRHDMDCQRIDRLTEAIARKANVDLIMPLPEPPPPERVSMPNPWKDPNPVTDFPKEKIS